MIEYGSRTKRLPAPPHVVWDDLRHRIRYRVNELLYNELRQSYDQ